MNATSAIKKSVMKRMKHPGFSAVANNIASREGVSQKAAGAILAASTRRAGSSARKANPRLNRVKGY